MLIISSTSSQYISRQKPVQSYFPSDPTPLGANSYGNFKNEAIPQALNFGNLMRMALEYSDVPISGGPGRSDNDGPEIHSDEYPHYDLRYAGFNNALGIDDPGNSDNFYNYDYPPSATYNSDSSYDYSDGEDDNDESFYGAFDSDQFDGFGFGGDGFNFEV